MLKNVKFLKLFLGFKLLSARERKMIIFLGIIILFSSAMETIAFGSVLPFLAFILEPGKIEGNKYYQYLFSFLKSPSRETMTYFLCALFTFSFNIVKYSNYNCKSYYSFI